MSLIARVPPSSDLESWNQVFVQKQYLPVLKHLHPFPTILDLGANVGYASAYFQEELPDSKILAVELDPSNYSILTSNFFGDSINAGVWSKECRLDIIRDFRDGKEWAYQAIEGDSVEGHTIEWFMSYMDWDRINLLKVDIEGGEVELFKDPSFLEYVDVLAIEIHDEYKIRPKILESLMNHDFVFENVGELTIAHRYG